MMSGQSSRVDAGESHVSGIPHRQHPISAEALGRLLTTIEVFDRLKTAEQARLDPWESQSLSVAEQALERARLALSQLHIDLCRQR
jgi:hypothetical protein